MSARAAISAVGAWWFLPVMLALGTVFPLLNDVVRSGYAVADLSSAGIGLAYNAPLLAAVTAYAWRGWARFHRPLRSVRNGTAVLVNGGWPLLLGGPVVGCVAVLISARTLPDDLPSWTLLLTFFAVLLCSAALGVALSWALPVVLAVPLAAAMCFAWINYLPATDSRALHQLTPPIDGFATSAQPATSAVVALLLLSITVVVGLLVVFGLAPWDRLPRPAGAALVLALVAGAAGLSWTSLGWTSQPINLMAAEPRSTILVCTRYGQLEVCLWPESASRGDELARLAAAANDRLRAWALPEITDLTGGLHRPGAANVDATRGSPAAQIAASLSQGYLNQRLGCEVIADREAEARVALLALAVNGAADMREQFSARTLADTADTLSLSRAQIGAWYDEGLRNMRCVPTP